MIEIKTHSRPVRLFYFWSGIIATFLYRAIIVLNSVSAFWVKVFWYVGTIGFVIYFAHRYNISERRAKLITQRKLQDKIPKLTELDEDDKQAMNYILETLVTTKEKWNYIAIFALSGLAVLIGVYLDFIK